MKARFLDTVLREAASAAADHGDGPMADAALLRRFVADRDQAAFAALVKRHARLVWAVCRQVSPSDAEDTFQATWLALVRHAGSIRNGIALPAWLHGTAYRVCLKANRTAGRRRGREEATAPREATRPVPDSAWDSLLAAVHEEIARLPAALRTAFVVCDLEGVPPGAAAARLGWKPGTLTGRLCQARQALVSRLTRRGLAPAAALAGCGVGAATAAATVPSPLLAAAASLPAASAVVPSTILELAQAVTEGTMTKMKLLAAGILVAGVLGLSGTASVLAQRPGQTGNQPPGPGGPPGAGIGAPAGQPPGGPGPGGTGPGAGPGAPGIPGGPGGQQGPGGMGGALSGLARGGPGGQWEYKVEPMPGDRNAFVNLLTNRGNEGWEYVGTASFGRQGAGGPRGGRPVPGEGGPGGRPGTGSPDGGGPAGAGPGGPPGRGRGPGGGPGGEDGEAFGDFFEPLQQPGGGGQGGGGAVDLVFKRPKGNPNRGGGGGGFGGAAGGGNPFGGGDGQPGFGGGGLGQAGGGGGGGFGGSFGGGPGASTPGGGGGSGGGRSGNRGGDRPGGPGRGTPAGPASPEEDMFKVIQLKKVAANEMASIIERVFPGEIAVVVEASSNSLIVRKASAKTVTSVEALIAELEGLDRNAAGPARKKD